MKKRIIFTFIAISSWLAGNAQENYGNTLNMGLGIGYYPYTNHPVPVFNANYEFNVAKNFTLAPSIGFYRYRQSYFWGSKDYPYRYYSYQETVVPIGIKSTYYFDDLLRANPKWDFYVGGSLGVALIDSRWEDGYFGDRNVYRNAYRAASPLYVDLHIGSEYHFNDRLGAFLDLSTGVSTIGLAFH